MSRNVNPAAPVPEEPQAQQQAPVVQPPAVAQPPQVPLEIMPLVSTDDVQRYRNMLDSMLVVEEPATGSFSSLAQTDLGNVAMKNGLGTPRPSKALIGADPNRTSMYVMPVDPNTPGSAKISYTKDRVSINLYQTFQKLDRLLTPGTREYYALKETPAPVRIGEITGYALYTSLVDFETAPVQTISDEEKQQRKQKREQKKAQKTNQETA